MRIGTQTLDSGEGLRMPRVYLRYGLWSLFSVRRLWQRVLVSFLVMIDDKNVFL